LQLASVYFAAATNGGNQALMKAAPTVAQADVWLDAKLKAPFAGDANDHLYQWEASRDYDPSHHLERITARVLVINSADDERNPPELGGLDAAIKRIKHASVLLIPASEDTAGHGTTALAKFWKHALAAALAEQ
jgi:homoserine O-acetyltransferase